MAAQIAETHKLQQQAASSSLSSENEIAALREELARVARREGPEALLIYLRMSTNLKIKNKKGKGVTLTFLCFVCIINIFAHVN